MLQPSFTLRSLLCMADPKHHESCSPCGSTSLVVRPTPVPQSYSHPSSSTLSTVHTIGCQAKRLQRPPSVSTATTAIAGTRQTLTVSSTTTPFASLGLIADPGQLHAEIRSYTRFSELMIVDRRQRMVQGKRGGRVLLSFSTQGFYILYYHMLRRYTTLHRQAHRSQRARRISRQYLLPSSVRSKSTSPSGPSSVDTPITTHQPSAL